MNRTLLNTRCSLLVVDCTSAESCEWASYGTIYFGAERIYRESLYINGQWTPGAHGKLLHVGNPAKNGEVFHTVCAGDETGMSLVDCY